MSFIKDNKDFIFMHSLKIHSNPNLT